MKGLCLVESEIVRSGGNAEAQIIKRIIGPLLVDNNVTVGLGNAKIECKIVSVPVESPWVSAVGILSIDFDLSSDTVVSIPDQTADELVFPKDAPDIVGRTSLIKPAKAISLIRDTAVVSLAMLNVDRRVGDILGAGEEL